MSEVRHEESVCPQCGAAILIWPLDRQACWYDFRPTEHGYIAMDHEHQPHAND